MTKLAAYGCILKRSSTTVAAVRSIEGPGLSADMLDVTTHDSTAAWREFVAGLIDGGEVTVEIVWDPDNASQASLRTDLVARTAQSYSVTFTDATPLVASFSAFVTEFKPNAPVEGELTASVTLKVTGAVSFA